MVMVQESPQENTFKGSQTIGSARRLQNKMRHDNIAPPKLL